MGFAKLGMVSVACCLFAIGCVADRDDIMSLEFTDSQPLSVEAKPELPDKPDKPEPIPPVESCGPPSNNKVLICHVVPQFQDITLCVDDHAVPAHLAHGDTLGACPGQPVPPKPPEYPDYPDYPPKP
ncbi:hypothetical protein [Polyangium jinanense]|uniref:Uncharacterized protein n=1 Tax=Polyangium jinanense TaxID=2829994 RepID=A0A9X4ASM4_9BACT|nr:hypothetical protein [Polyangium jinanense]MDC3954893.1 hypothetical protein [Polyangium jinanense]MDC3981337.1 hypothetical protein [Polyangium jinanense]